LTRAAFDRAAQYDVLHAVVMIQVDVQGSDVEVMTGVMALCQPACEITLVMVEDVG
jgi:hypothetical protein